MIGILTALICVNGVCQTVYIPTPMTFECGQRYPAQDYLKAKFGEDFDLIMYNCKQGRAA